MKIYQVEYQNRKYNDSNKTLEVQAANCIQAIKKANSYAKNDESFYGFTNWEIIKCEKIAETI